MNNAVEYLRDAAECIHLATRQTSIEHKARLLQMAEAWIYLVYRPRKKRPVRSPQVPSSRTAERNKHFTAKNRLPAMYQQKRFVAAGGLMSYGIDMPNLFRRGALYVHRVLQGARNLRTCRSSNQRASSGSSNLKTRAGARPQHPADRLHPRRRGERPDLVVGTGR